MTKSPSAAAAQPPLDDRPGLQIVGQRDRAEIVAERRAEPRRGRLHRGDARHDAMSSARQAGSPALDRLEHRRRHGEDAGIAARDDARRAGPPRRGRARGGRGRARRGCRWRGGAGPARAARGRDRARSRRGRSRAASAALASGVSQSRRARARGRRRERAASRPPPLAGHEHQREIGRRVVALSRERQ